MTTPALSVIFSSYNGSSRRLRETLDSFCRQDFGGEWEIIAVDNNSSDDTASVLTSYADRIPIKVLSHPEPGKSGALNHALDVARGALLVMTDDDVVAETNWLTELHRCATDHGDFGIIGGRIEPAWEVPPAAPFVAWIPMGSTFAIADEEPSGPCDPTKVWGPNTTFRREALGDIRYREDIGPLPQKLFAMGEDSEIVVRMARKGVRAYRCNSAVVHHWIPASSVSEEWVQKRGERLGYGQPALSPERVPSGPRIADVPLATWLESMAWAARAGALYFLPSSRLRFWALWKHNYMRGYRAGIRRYASARANSRLGA